MEKKFYRNPVVCGFNPDPSVCRVGRDYYLATSSFAYFPGVPIYHSRDLINWELIGHALERPEQLRLNSEKNWSGIYAPTLRYDRGRFYLVTTNVEGGGNFLVTAERAAGPWSDPLWIDDGQFDPSLFFDDDGKVYYTRRGPSGIVQAEFDVKTGKTISPLRKILDGFTSRDTEGPHLYKRGGFYYLLTAEGGTRFLHRICIGRSAGPWGPFEPFPQNPILMQFEGYDNEIRSTGHGELVEAHDGSLWLFFLATRHPSYDALSHLGRETFILPIDWSAGWPTVKAEYLLHNRIPLSGPARASQPIASFREDFLESLLRPEWYHWRQRHERSQSLQARPGYLRLWGRKDSLDEGTPLFIGIKQTAFRFKARVDLEMNPGDTGVEAGLVVFQAPLYHFALLLSRVNGNQEVVLRRTVGGIRDEKVLPCSSNYLQLHLSSDGHYYRFSFIQYPNHQGQPFTLGEAPCQLLGTELASTFTGAMIGLYARTLSKGKDAVPADFSHFIYSPLDGTYPSE
jgi:xylan 1,4-beta-xylosidase